MRWRLTAPAYCPLNGLRQPHAVWAACRPLLLLQTAALQQQSQGLFQQHAGSLRNAAAIAERAVEARTSDGEPATVEVWGIMAMDVGGPSWMRW